MDMPTAEDYIRAVQHPRVSFLPANLKQARFEVHPLLGIPMPASGTSAIVFKATVDGQSQALRFLTRPDAATQQRYTALNRYFTERDLTQDVATSQWVDNAIVVNGRTWPMLQMQWVEGRTLNNYVEDLVESEDTASISELADAWRGLLRRMQSARFAHGDLQHGNVMVEGDGTLRLVDFDSAWIEPFAGTPPPPETGHRNYQRPDRPWGPWMDTFPGLVIYLSLLALSRNTKAWEHLHNGENLLFHSDDFTPPHQSRAWWEIAQLSDPRLTTMSSRLKACCAPSWTANADLEALLSAPLPWWTQTSTSTIAKPKPLAATPPPVRTPRLVRPGVAAQGQTPGTWWTPQPPPAPAPPPPAAAPQRVRKWRSIVLVSVLAWVVSTIAITGLVSTDAGSLGAFVASSIVAGATFTFLASTRKRPPKPPGRKR
jgi:eukaryotic-like serine/threonine-protein kinase